VMRVRPFNRHCSSVRQARGGLPGEGDARLCATQDHSAPATDLARDDRAREQPARRRSPAHHVTRQFLVRSSPRAGIQPTSRASGGSQLRARAS
jgi:hypothetical protein